MVFKQNSLLNLSCAPGHKLVLLWRNRIAVGSPILLKVRDLTSRECQIVITVNYMGYEAQNPQRTLCMCVCVSVVLRLRLVNTLQCISLLLMMYNYPNRTRLGGRRHLIFKLFSACPLSHSVSIIGFIGSIMEKVKKYFLTLSTPFPFSPIIHGLRKYTFRLFILGIVNQV